ncbi:hypothetical protein KC19_1G281300 [Ceratodon purpureus]|uniref:Secreted protein n=1 Tax=Ceratodon purpureus TaxID=3225 RepID=A0A8T0JCP4_CERPU|nr:hypothetical protein KC19_1G281300 [Ceratodon purpureus]
MVAVGGAWLLCASAESLCVAMHDILGLPWWCRRCGGCPVEVERVRGEGNAATSFERSHCACGDVTWL